MPEIITIKRSGSGYGLYSIDILEWDGKAFHNLSPNLVQHDVENVIIEKSDVDNSIELQLVIGGQHWSCCYPNQFPLREFTDTYKWSNVTLEQYKRQFNKPEFRFQATQDGDMETSSGNYDDAKNLYQKAISNAALDWWSKERAEFTNMYFRSGHPETNPTPPPVELDDKAIKYEYNSIAAYAHYRIMLLDLVQGQESEAFATYQTLQDIFGKDPYGSPYVAMATSFWNAYQTNHKMYDGCAAAIQYAAEHPEILIPLGSDYHGSQSHTYIPSDVCPFR